MESCIYTGLVRHRRHRPVEHAFAYRLFMMYLDLAELDRVFRGRWLWSNGRRNLACFLRKDYHGDPDVPLDECIRKLVQDRTGHRPAGPIRLLTQLRYFGYIFNPVSFYYCHAPEGSELEFIVAEITNTPWKERHAYVLDAREGGEGRVHRFCFAKSFHVSPFMPMNHRYDWRFNTPGEKLSIHMTNFEHERPIHEATMTLERKPITGASLAASLIGYPLMTHRIIAAIYWQALRLRLKRVPFHSHPKWSTRATEVQTP